MSLLGEIGAINSLLNGASALLREWKKPKLSDEQFADVLKAQMNPDYIKVQDQARQQEQAKKVEALTVKFIDTRDIDRDGLLTRDESGLLDQDFKKLDLDKDGKLSKAEVARGYWLQAGLEPPKDLK